MTPVVNPAFAFSCHYILDTKRRHRRETAIRLLWPVFGRTLGYARCRRAATPEIHAQGCLDRSTGPLSNSRLPPHLSSVAS